MTKDVAHTLRRGGHAFEVGLVARAFHQAVEPGFSGGAVHGHQGAVAGSKALGQHLRADLPAAQMGRKHHHALALGQSGFKQLDAVPLHMGQARDFTGAKPHPRQLAHHLPRTRARAMDDLPGESQALRVADEFFSVGFGEPPHPNAQDRAQGLHPRQGQTREDFKKDRHGHCILKRYRAHGGG